MAQANTENVARPDVEIGATGTVITNGILSNTDYNSDLVGSRGIEKFDEMRRGDATVRAALQAIFLPILSANWFVQPASDEQRDKDVADFVHQALFEDMSVTWQDTLRQALNYLTFGHYVFEIVYRLREDGRITWKKFSPRLPETIWSWETKDQQPGITQLTPSGHEASIPIEKLVILVNEKEGDNWTGQSILRAAYKHWYIKDALYKIDAMAHERQGLGIPVIRFQGTPSEKDLKDAQSLLQNLRANEESHAVIEGKKMELEFLDMKTGGTRNPEFSISHHDRQITKSVLAQFLELGASKSGSYALSQDQSKLFLLSLEAAARHIAQAFQKYAIRRLVDLNFSVEAYPTLEFGKIGDKNVAELSTAIQRFVQTGLLTPDPTLENYLRDVTDLPEVPEGHREEAELMATLDDMEQEAMSMGDAMDVEEVDEGDDELAEIEATEILGGAPGQPLSEETKKKISEALRKKLNKGKGKAKKPKKAPTKANPEIAKLRTEYQNAVTDARLKVLERKAKGEKLEPEEMAKMQLDLMKRQMEMRKKIAELPARVKANDRADLDTVRMFKERVDAVLDTIAA